MDLLTQIFKKYIYEKLFEHSRYKTSLCKLHYFPQTPWLYKDENWRDVLELLQGMVKLN